MKRLLLLIAIAAAPAFGACTAATLSGGVNVIQCGDSQTSTAGTSKSLAFTSNNALGSLVTVVCSYFDSPTVTVSVSDSQSNTYTALTSLLAQGNLKMRVFFAPNVKAGANTPACGFSSSVAFNGIQISEYTGVAKVNPLDVSASATGSGLSTASGSVVTTSQDLIIGFMNCSATTSVTSTGALTVRINDTSPDYFSQDGVALAVGSTVGSAFALAGSSPNWLNAVGAFRIASTGAAMLLSQ